MSLNITELYKQDFISKLGNEYVCTGFMYDIAPTQGDPLAQLQGSWDLSGIIEGEVEEFMYSEKYGQDATTENADVSTAMTTGESY